MLRNRPNLRIFLLGKPAIQLNGKFVNGFGGRKTQELLGYLILHRDRSHFRERLAELLWSEKKSSQSRRYLRQTLWQIQTTLHNGNSNVNELIEVESNWVHINPEAEYWADVAQLEEIAYSVHRIQGYDLPVAKANMVRATVDLYRGDLLENCYEDWCILERARLQDIYLGLVDKLMDYCLAHHEFGIGVVYGGYMLRYDNARERTYRKLMRCFYMNNDRTGALRQYWRCCRALDKEFGIQPTQETVALYEQIRDGKPLELQFKPIEQSTPSTTTPLKPESADILRQLEYYTSSMIEIQKKLQQSMNALRKELQNKQ